LRFIYVTYYYLLVFSRLLRPANGYDLPVEIKFRREEMKELCKELS
jgi:hypothetical protein